MTVVVALFVVVDLLYFFSLVAIMDGLKEVLVRRRGMLEKADIPQKVADLRANQEILINRQNRILGNQEKIKEELQGFHIDKEELRKRR